MILTHTLGSQLMHKEYCYYMILFCKYKTNDSTTKTCICHLESDFSSWPWLNFAYSSSQGNYFKHNKVLECFTIIMIYVPFIWLNGLVKQCGSHPDVLI